MNDNISDKAGELRVRIISALVLAPVVLGAVWLGGVYFSALLALAGVLMAREIFPLLDREAPLSDIVPLAIVAVLAVLIAGGGSVTAGVMLLIAGLLFGLGQRLWGGRALRPALVAYPYVILPLMALVWLRLDAELGRWAVFWLLFLVWATDVGAYFAGRGIGGPKLSPRFSPNKTWAGLGGGVVAAALVGLVTSLLLGVGSPLLLALLSGLLAVVAQAGDIAESALKRGAGVKDSGTLIPGHGGILDRVDGLVAAAVAAALLALLHGSASPSVGVLIWP